MCPHARVNPNHNDTKTPKGKRRTVTKALVQEKQNPFPKSVTMKERLHREHKRSPKVKIAEEDTGNPFTPRIHYFDLPKMTRMKSNVKTYDGSEDLEVHLKIFQAAAKVKRWAMPIWCYMFNSMLTRSARVWFDDLPPESVDSYDDLKKAFLVNFLQQKKCIKDPVEIHHIKQREGESTEDFMQRFKYESRHVKGASECMRISGFMHEITNPELIKRLHENILICTDIANITKRAKTGHENGWEVKEEMCPHARVNPNHNDTKTPKGKRRTVTKALVQEKQNPFPKSVTMKERLHREHKRSLKVKIAEEDTGSQDKKKSSIKEDDLSQPWMCEETDPFTPRIHYFDLPKMTRMKSNVKTYDGSEDLEKCIKDPVEIHHIKQREGESTEDFMQRFKYESRHVKGASECMRISGFMHEITNPELIKRLHENILI
nr:reverse transcriptase domain-containing protein [Tanacetum cinerariifolium]